MICAIAGGLSTTTGNRSMVFVHEGLWERIENIFRVFGWEVVTLKYGQLQMSAFSEPGGDALKKWIDQCPNQLYSALTFQGGAVWRQRLLDDIGDQGAVSDLIGRRSDLELAALMENLGGNCVATLSRAFSEVGDDKPTCFPRLYDKGLGDPPCGT